MMKGRKNHLGISQSQKQAGSVGSTKHGAELHFAHRYCTLRVRVGVNGLWVGSTIFAAKSEPQMSLSAVRSPGTMHG